MLLLKSLELLRHFRRHAAVRLTPAIVSLLGDLKQLADVRDLLAFAQLDVRATELGANLLGRVTLRIQF